jgi:hypothetical protein
MLVTLLLGERGASNGGAGEASEYSAAVDRLLFERHYLSPLMLGLPMAMLLLIGYVPRGSDKGKA